LTPDELTIRKNAMRHLAHRIGAVFYEKDTAGILDLAGDFHRFRTAYRKSVSNVIALDRHWGKLYVMDLEFAESRANIFNRNRQTICFISSRQLGLPEFRIFPRSLFQKIIGFFSPPNDGITDSERFNRNYQVKTDNESLLKMFIDKDVARYIGGKTGYHLEGVGFYLLIYSDTPALEGKMLGAFLEDCLTIGHLMAESGKMSFK